MRVPEHREEKITALLERWPELRETLNGGLGVAGDGGSLTLMPHERRCLLQRRPDREWHRGMDTTPATCTCAYRGVSELERLLRRMRDDQAGYIVRVGDLVPMLRPAQAEIRLSVRALWWHVSQRYVVATSRTVDRPVTRRGKNGKKLHVLERQVVPVYSQRVNLLVVRAGVRWLAEGWSLDVEPFMPQELLVAA